VESHVQALARAQTRLGAQVKVICVNHRNASSTDITWRAFGSTRTVVEHDEGVEVVRLGRRASMSRLDLCPSLLGALWKMRDTGVDVLHVHAPNPTMFLALAALPPFPTLLVTHHSDVIKQQVLARVFAPFERVVHDRAALVLVDSEPYIGGSSVLQSLGSKVRALPLGIRLSAFAEPTAEVRDWEARLRSDLGDPLWLAVGRLVYYKGLATALDALRDVPGRLLIVGTGPAEAQLRERARRRGVADRVEWAGHTSDAQLLGAYRAATALWFPSNARSEGFGLVQVEAMASGCPVINTAIPHSGVPWVSRHDESGLTIAVGDADALAAASRRMLREPGLRERLAHGAVERAHREFDDSVMAGRSLALYEEAMRARRPASRVGKTVRAADVSAGAAP
jgi:rhamnosyl/mannosyltransferase